MRVNAAMQASDGKSRQQGNFAEGHHWSLGSLYYPVCDKMPSLTTLATQVDIVESRLQGLLDLGLSDKAVADMLSGIPTLLGYQSKQLQAMREYLGGLAGLSEADMASLLQKEPRILSYSVAGVLGDLHYALLCMCPQCLLVKAGSEYL